MNYESFSRPIHSKINVRKPKQTCKRATLRSFSEKKVVRMKTSNSAAKRKIQRKRDETRGIFRGSARKNPNSAVGLEIPRFAENCGPYIVIRDAYNLFLVSRARCYIHYFCSPK